MLAVSLRLQMLTPPGFISLTKIVRTLMKVRETFLKMRDHERLSVEGTLDKLSEYAKTDNIMKKADAVFMATQRPMVHIDSSGKEAGNAIGMAPRGGICTKDKVAIGKDKPGTYSGISTIVHELGHLLGLPHDGDKGAEACLGNHGYIMSPVHGGKRDNEWSQCSKNLVKEVLRSRKYWCLNENKNKHLSPLKLKLKPGMVINGEEYCTKSFPNYNAKFDESLPTDNCSFRCKLETSGAKTKEATIFAPEGTPCQPGKHEKKCRYGLCI
ncbi:A disintegrin and metalloproteinase with thrombospondin motifs 17-like [Rhipicephalus sanguineus]|uniref:A disintegrin and metalloproteinase with thrombospondin motifs 17-like n=1 Tax=Rhipicephalus sanguineus TaxID=34632 RepID=UPI0020C27D32|nr:A disintegrin and metalloproteinase with thrombospondin motifs 17-like [Rhipicephalus sanguineus]